MNRFILLIPIVTLLFTAACTGKQATTPVADTSVTDTSAVDTVPLPVTEPEIHDWTADDITIRKDIAFEKYTLEDEYPYRDTVRYFQWDKVKALLAAIENMQRDTTVQYIILNNYRNQNQEAPIVKNFQRNNYTRICDSLGTERYQSAPLYALTDTLTPEIYGRDGSLAWLNDSTGNFWRIRPVVGETEWLVPRRYVRLLPSPTSFRHVIIVDRHNQNIATLESDSVTVWRIRSMNPATTGRFAPPYAQKTPLGMYVIQEKKTRMLYYKDGTTELAGYAPYASRFTNGAYIHGVPVDDVEAPVIEYSWSLGTTPRSHMCVRNATSHSKFIFDWAPTHRTLVCVIE